MCKQRWRGPSLLLLASLLALPASAGHAQSAAAPAAATPVERAEPDEPQIVVIGDRTIVAQLQDLEPEDSYDDSRIASYGANSVGELINAITQEKGDDTPALLVNGKPTADLGDISDLPIEAVRRVEVLPVGSAARVGGAAGQRAYNVVLVRQLRNVTVAASHQRATEGRWGNTRGEMVFTRINGQDRINLSLRAGWSDRLTEVDRGLTAPLPAFAFSSPGNVLPLGGVEIDPAFSTLAGATVNVIGLPGGAIPPDLAALLGGANRPNGRDVGAYRILRGESRPIDLTISGSKVLAPWLSLSFNGRLGWTQTTGWSGLPSARFQLPATHPVSPFSRAVMIALDDPQRPLESRSAIDTAGLSATLNANLNAWRVTATARLDRSRFGYSYDQVGLIPGGSILIDDAVDPFDPALAARIPVTGRFNRSTSLRKELFQDADGPLFGLPGGDVRLRFGYTYTWLALDGEDSEGRSDRSFRRTERAGRVGLTVPLTTARAGGGLGDSELLVDIGRLSLGQFGRIERWSLGLNWRPAKWLRWALSTVSDGRAVTAELASANTFTNQNVVYFDPVNNRTELVTLISGGNPGLLPETNRQRRVSVVVGPFGKSRVQATIDYSENSQRNQIGGLPPPSAEIVAAFPDRFVRDGAGRLIAVDSRAVNFERQELRQLRSAVDLNIPLSQAASGAPGGRAALSAVRRSPPTSLQLRLAHTWALSSKAVIRSGLGEVDLLSGGVIGPGGGRQRHLVDGSVVLMRGGTGVRLNGAWRSSSQLRSGTPTNRELYMYGATARFDLRILADLQQVWSDRSWAKGARVTLAVDNLLNSRQPVASLSGAIPLGLNPRYRDPIGRTVMIELRKVF